MAATQSLTQLVNKAKEIADSNIDTIASSNNWSSGMVTSAVESVKRYCAYETLLNIVSVFERTGHDLPVPVMSDRAEDAVKDILSYIDSKVLPKTPAFTKFENVKEIIKKDTVMNLIPYVHIFPWVSVRSLVATASVDPSMSGTSLTIICVLDKGLDRYLRRLSRYFALFERSILDINIPLLSKDTTGVSFTVSKTKDLSKLASFETFGYRLSLQATQCEHLAGLDLEYAVISLKVNPPAPSVSNSKNKVPLIATSLCSIDTEGFLLPYLKQSQEFSKAVPKVISTISRRIPPVWKQP